MGMNKQMTPLEVVQAQYAASKVLSELKSHLGRGVLFLVCSCEKQPDRTRGMSR